MAEEKQTILMAKLLIVCTGLFSNLSSSIALAQRLRADGFEITFCAPKENLAKISEDGFPVLEILPPKLAAGGRYLPKPKLLERFKGKQRRAQLAVEHILGDGVKAVLDQFEPDLVLVDCEHHSAIIQSAAAGYKVLLLSFMYFTPPSPTAPPLTSQIIPGQGITGSKIDVRFAWWKIARQKRLKLAQAAFKGWGADMPTAHRALAKALSFDLETNITQTEFQMPWGYRLPTLFLLSEKLDFPTELRPDQYFAGPHALGSADDVSLPDEVSRYFAPAPEKRRIYAGFGSMRNPPKSFMRALIAAIARNPQWELLLANKDENLTNDISIPGNVTIVSWAPQYEALKVADCAIFHGGAGTLNECLLTGTPMLIYPNALDGKGNAARVAFHGVGAIGGYKDRTEVIEESIQAVLDDAELSSRLGALQTDAQSGLHQSRATEIIKSMLN